MARKVLGGLYYGTSGFPPKIGFFFWRLLRNALPMDDRLRYMGFEMPDKCHCCIRSQQESWLHLFCQGETASQVWSYLKGVLNASFVQDSMSAFTKTWLQGSSIKSQMVFLSPRTERYIVFSSLVAGRFGLLEMHLFMIQLLCLLHLLSKK